MKTILCSLLLLFSLKFYAQSEKFKESYSEYEKALKSKDFNKALENIDKCINYLENSGIKDTLYANAIFDKSKIYFLQSNYEETLRLIELVLTLRKDILGFEHLNIASTCNILASIYSRLGQYEKSKSLYEQALEIRTKILGENHIDVASILNNLALIYSELGQYEKAIKYTEKSLKINKEIYGDKHPDYATSINNLALIYCHLGQFKNALPLYKNALKIDKKNFGKKHPSVATSLGNLGNVYAQLGQYEKALSLIDKALKIRTEVYGNDHEAIASTINSLAWLYSDLGQYKKAETLFDEALKIRIKVYGEEHPKVASSLNSLAKNYYNLGHNNYAQPLYEKALKMKIKLLGKEHHEVAVSMNDLADFYSEIGQFEKAMQLYDESLKISILVYGERHFKVLAILLGKARLYSMFYHYEKATQYSEKALNLCKDIYGEEHPDYATCMNNLALIYCKLKQYESAISLLEKALVIYKKHYGEYHPTFATNLNNLAGLYSDIKQYEKAEALFKESFKLRKQIFGERHPDVASNLHNLASLYSQMGQYEKSKFFFEEFFKISKKVFSDYDPIVSTSLNNLSFVYYELGQYEKGAELQKQSLIIRCQQLKNNLPTLSDNVKTNFIQQVGFEFESYDGLLFNDKKEFGSPVFSLNNNLLLNNLVLQSNEAMRKSILTSNDTLLIDDLENWLALKQHYANAQALSLVELKNKGIDLKALEDTIEIKERSLSQRSQAFQTEQQKLELNYESLKANLKAEEATVMFHSFRYYNGKVWTDSTLYTAYIIRKDQKQPEMVYLFEQAALDTLLPAPDTRSMMNNLYQTGDSALYNLVWKPLEPYLKGVKTAYVAPSGLLHKIAFAAVPLPDGSRLSDRYQLRQVLSGHDVVFKEDPAVFNNASTTSVALLGGINYEYLPEAKDTVYFSPLSLLPESTDRGTAFGYLPGTESEVSSIEHLLKNDKVNVTLLKGNNATEEQFKTLQGDKAPKVLHIATHGFFAPDPKRDLNKENNMRLIGQENRYTAADNPLYRSGLLLAGGNSSWTKKATLPADQDGVLTAYEVANMDLSNTQLVVLSACETALGAVKGREGVFGLQRGFRLAGAKYMLMSLWRIPDKETAEYMTKFYSELAKTNNIVTAYQTTQNHMKATYPNEPQIWAGMVLVE